MGVTCPLVARPTYRRAVKRGDALAVQGLGFRTARRPSSSAPHEDAQNLTAHRSRLYLALVSPAGLARSLDLPVQVRHFGLKVRDPLAQRRQFGPLGVPPFGRAV